MSGQFKCIGFQCLQRGNYSIQPLRECDIISIMHWRNAQMDILRQKVFLTEEQQRSYWERVISPTFDAEYPSQLLFSFLENGQLIGYGGLVHVQWEDKRAEVSYLVEPERTLNAALYELDFSTWLDFLKEIAFRHLKLNKLTTEIYDIRPQHVAIVESAGFRKEGVLRNHVHLRGHFIDSLCHAFFAAQYGSPQQDAAEHHFLITSASRKIPLLEAVRRAGLKFSSKPKITVADSSDSCLAKYFADEFWKMPALQLLTDAQFIDYCREHGVTHIIPTRDAELEWFSLRREVLQDAGIEVMISAENAIKTCRDKLQFAKLPGAIPAYTELPKDATGYWVVKERFGAGSQGIGLRLDPLAALEYEKKLKEPIYQPFLEGAEVSIDVYVCKAGAMKGGIVRSRDLTINGESQVTTIIDCPAALAACEAVVSLLPFYGHLVFQAILTPQGVKLIECNPRFGGASTLSVAAGLDSFAWFIAESGGANSASFEGNPKLKLQQIRVPMDHIREVI